MMSTMGADCYGIDPDQDAIRFALAEGLIDNEKAIACTLQDLPKDMVGSFDIATVWLFNVAYLI